MAVYSVKVTKTNEWASEGGSTATESGYSHFRPVRLRGRSAGWVKTGERSSVLVVRLLLARAGDSILGLAGARAQPVQSPTILCVVDVVLKKKLQGLKKELDCFVPWASWDKV